VAAFVGIRNETRPSRFNGRTCAYIGVRGAELCRAPDIRGGGIASGTLASCHLAIHPGRASAQRFTSARCRTISSSGPSGSFRDGLFCHLAKIGAVKLASAYRHTLLLHSDWKSALIEKQIGWVDRLESLWFKDFAARSSGNEPPRIEIATVVLDGTSNAEKRERRDRIVARQRLLKAHIFGDVLAPEMMHGLKCEWQTRIRDAALDFSPRHWGG
jgi:hypothetical protein